MIVPNDEIRHTVFEMYMEKTKQYVQRSNN